MLANMMFNPSFVEDLLNGHSEIPLSSYLDELTVQELDFIIEKICEKLFDCFSNLRQNEGIILKTLENVLSISGHLQLVDIQAMLLSRPLLFLIVETGCTISIIKKCAYALNRFYGSQSILQCVMEDESVKQAFIMLGNIIREAGDYECQMSLIELMLRIARFDNINQWADSWFPEENFKSCFLSLTPDKFELGCRRFLRLINSESGKKVHSFVACSIIFDLIKIKEPYGSDLWVDFNYSTRCITFYCTELITVEDNSRQGLWETITLGANVVDCCFLNVGLMKWKKELVVMLNCSCSEVLSNPNEMSRSFFKGKMIKFYFRDYMDVHPHLEYIYGFSYMGCQLTSYQPSFNSSYSVPTNRKVSQNMPICAAGNLNEECSEDAPEESSRQVIPDNSSELKISHSNSDEIEREINSDAINADDMTCEESNMSSEKSSRKNKKTHKKKLDSSLNQRKTSNATVFNFSDVEDNYDHAENVSVHANKTSQLEKRKVSEAVLTDKEEDNCVENILDNNTQNCNPNKKTSELIDAFIDDMVNCDKSYTSNEILSHISKNKINTNNTISYENSLKECDNVTNNDGENNIPQYRERKSSEAVVLNNEETGVKDLNDSNNPNYSQNQRKISNSEIVNISNCDLIHYETVEIWSHEKKNQQKSSNATVLNIGSNRDCDRTENVFCDENASQSKKRKTSDAVVLNECEETCIEDFNDSKNPNCNQRQRKVSNSEKVDASNYELISNDGCNLSDKIQSHKSKNPRKISNASISDVSGSKDYYNNETENVYDENASQTKKRKTSHAVVLNEYEETFDDVNDSKSKNNRQYRKVSTDELIDALSINQKDLSDTECHRSASISNLHNITAIASNDANYENVYASRKTHYERRDSKDTSNALKAKKSDTVQDSIENRKKNKSPDKKENNIMKRRASNLKAPRGFLWKLMEDSKQIDCDSVKETAFFKNNDNINEIPDIEVEENNVDNDVSDLVTHIKYVFESKNHTCRSTSAVQKLLNIGQTGETPVQKKKLKTNNSLEDAFEDLRLKSPSSIPNLYQVRQEDRISEATDVDVQISNVKSRDEIINENAHLDDSDSSAGERFPFQVGKGFQDAASEESYEDTNFATEIEKKSLYSGFNKDTNNIDSGLVLEDAVIEIQTTRNDSQIGIDYAFEYELDELVSQIPSKQVHLEKSSVSLSKYIKKAQNKNKNYGKASSIHDTLPDKEDYLKRPSDVNAMDKKSKTTKSRTIRLYNPDKAPLCSVDLNSPKQKKSFSKDLFSVVIPPEDESSNESDKIYSPSHSNGRGEIQSKRNSSPSSRKFKSHLDRYSPDIHPEVNNGKDIEDSPAFASSPMSKKKSLTKTIYNDSGICIDKSLLYRSSSLPLKRFFPSSNLKAISLMQHNVRSFLRGKKQLKTKKSNIKGISKNKTSATTSKKSKNEVNDKTSASSNTSKKSRKAADVATVKNSKLFSETYHFCDDVDSNGSSYRPPRPDKRLWLYAPDEGKNGKTRSNNLKKSRSQESEVSWFNTSGSIRLFESPKKNYTVRKKGKKSTIKPIAVQMEGSKSTKVSQRKKKPTKSQIKKNGINSEHEKRSIQWSEFDSYSLVKEKKAEPFDTSLKNKVLKDFDDKIKNSFRSSENEETNNPNTTTKGFHDIASTVTNESESMHAENVAVDDFQDNFHTGDIVNLSQHCSDKRENDFHIATSKPNAPFKTDQNINPEKVNELLDEEEAYSDRCVKDFKVNPQHAKNILINKNVTKPLCCNLEIGNIENLKELSPKEYKALTDEANGKQFLLHRYLEEANSNSPISSYDNFSTNVYYPEHVEDVPLYYNRPKRRNDDSVMTEEQLAKRLRQSHHKPRQERTIPRKKNIPESMKEKKRLFSTLLDESIQKLLHKKIDNLSVQDELRNTPIRSELSYSNKRCDSYASYTDNPVSSHDEPKKLFDQSIFSMLSHEVKKLTRQFVGTVQKYTHDFCKKLSSHRENMLKFTEVLSDQDTAVIEKHDLIKYQKECRNKRLLLQNSLKKIQGFAAEYFKAEEKCDKKLKHIEKKASKKFTHHVHRAKLNAEKIMEKELLSGLRKHMAKFHMEFR